MLAVFAFGGMILCGVLFEVCEYAGSGNNWRRVTRGEAPRGKLGHVLALKFRSRTDLEAAFGRHQNHDIGGTPRAPIN